MISIAFRQVRGALLGTSALTGVLVAVLVIHGAIARGVSSRLMQACISPETDACRSLQSELGNMFRTIAPYLGYLTITTVLVAAFWGAPLVSREVESGTAALAWCQTVTRRRWFISRLIVSVALLATLGLLLGFAVTWWLASFTAAPQAGGNVLNTIDLHGPLLPATWLAGLLIGVLIGAVIPRVLPAVAITAVITFIGAIGLNLAGGMSTTIPVGELQVLAAQSRQAIPLLLLGAGAALVAVRRVDRVAT